MEYVRTQLSRVPPNIPTLVLGTCRDLGNNRKVFKEDIQELLHGSDRVKVEQRPHELHYFECSLLNCYGLQVLHKYLRIPFLHLKMSSLRQQLRLMESDLATSKHDISVSISEQRYVDYVDYIKKSDIDVRTGRAKGLPERRRSSGSIDSERRMSSDTIENVITEVPTPKATTPKAVVVIPEDAGEEEKESLQEEIAEKEAEIVENEEEKTVDVVVEEELVKEHVELDKEDLPERTHSAVNRQFSFKLENEKTQEKECQPITSPPAAPAITSTPTSIPIAITPTSKANVPVKINKLESLEDFQVNMDLDSFYKSDDEEDDNQVN